VSSSIKTWFSVSALAFASIGVEAPASAWLFSEHAEISATALARHDADHPDLSLRARLGSVLGSEHVCWQDGDGSGLHGEGSSKLAECIPYSALPALAADHSCSPGDLEANLAGVVMESYPLRVIKTARAFRELDLRAGSDVSKRLDNRRWLDLQLRIDDSAYATRAAANGAHFQLPRVAIRTPLVDHLRRVLSPKAELNAMGLYVNFHGAALLYARAAHNTIKSGASVSWSKWAFLSEALAQHFLQDSFSAGHMVGARGGVPDRIGTHDYYCENGIEARTWNGKEDYFAHGDGFMSLEERTLVVSASEESFNQVAHAFYDDDSKLPAELTRAIETLRTTARPKYDLNVCNATKMAGTLEPLANAAFVDEVVETWPVPVPDAPLPPRFPAELLYYAGVSTQGLGSVGWSTLGGSASGEVLGFGGLTLGVAAEGISSRRMEATSYFDFYVFGARWRDGSSILNLPAAFHVHAPFAYLPLDGILFGILAEKTQIGWVGGPAYAAASGTAYGGFEAIHYLGSHTFQIVLGRDTTMSWFRTKDRHQQEWNLLLPLLAAGELPDQTLHTAFEWNLMTGVEFARKTQITEASDADPFTRRRTDLYIGGYLSFLTQTRIVALP
jgi:hypothetical protein